MKKHSYKCTDKNTKVDKDKKKGKIMKPTKDEKYKGIYYKIRIYCICIKINIWHFFSSRLCLQKCKTSGVIKKYKVLSSYWFPLFQFNCRATFILIH